MNVFAKSFGVRFAIIGCSLLCASLRSTITRADCGDYVIVGRPLTPSSTDWRSRFQLADMNRLSEPVHQSHRQPCHGPTCHSRDSLPSPPTEASSLSVQQWAHL